MILPYETFGGEEKIHLCESQQLHTIVIIGEINP